MKPGEPLCRAVRPCSVMTPVASGVVGTRVVGYGHRCRSRVVHRGMGPGHQSGPVFGQNKGKSRKSANFSVFLEFLEKVLIFDIFDIFRHF